MDLKLDLWWVPYGMYGVVVHTGSLERKEIVRSSNRVCGGGEGADIVLQGQTGECSQQHRAKARPPRLHGLKFYHACQEFVFTSCFAIALWSGKLAQHSYLR